MWREQTLRLRAKRRLDKRRLERSLRSNRELRCKLWDKTRLEEELTAQLRARIEDSERAKEVCDTLSEELNANKTATERLLSDLETERERGECFAKDMRRMKQSLTSALARAEFCSRTAGDFQMRYDASLNRLEQNTAESERRRTILELENEKLAQECVRLRSAKADSDDTLTKIMDLFSIVRRPYLLPALEKVSQVLQVLPQLQSFVKEVYTVLEHSGEDAKIADSETALAKVREMVHAAREGRDLRARLGQILSIQESQGDEAILSKSEELMSGNIETCNKYAMVCCDTMIAVRRANSTWDCTSCEIWRRCAGT
ncbi:MAG: hypothetical protein P4M11_11265 [Candidatus Pacebacteria bacterium]|nr:hypothetical protein [Candidatus Paceibacterota bacterium]